MESIEKSMLETYVSSRLRVRIRLDNKEAYEGIISAFDNKVIALDEGGMLSMVYIQYITRIEVCKK